MPGLQGKRKNMKIPLSKIAEIVEGKIMGNPEKHICGAAPFDDAAEDDITFAGSPKFLKRIDETSAGAVIVPRNFHRPSKNLVLVDNPQLAFAMVLTFFHTPSRPKTGICSNVYTGKNFTCGKDVSIASFVVIQDSVVLGDRVTLHPNVVIGDDVVIGNDVVIYSNATVLDRCTIGSRVIIHAGSVIGSDGFGFANDGKRYYKIPHTGAVQIDDDVEIGAGNTIDRATFGKTWIKSGVKTDNLVHIAHNVTVGENTVLAAQVGIAGSATIGKHVVIAGQAAVAPHITIGDDVTIGPQSGIARSIPDGKVVSGTPEMPHRLWLRVQGIIPRLPELKKRLSEIEKRLNMVEGRRVNEKDL